MALDIKQTGVWGLPLQFSGNNLVKSIRSGSPQDTQSLRLLVDLTEDGKTRAVKQQNGANYTVVFTINADAAATSSASDGETGRSAGSGVASSTPPRNPFKTLAATEPRW